MIEIYSIVYQPEKSEYKPPYQYNRLAVESAELKAGHGIVGDLKAGHNPKRHLNIMSYETLMAMGGEGYKINPGQMGEQLIIKGLEVNTLEYGAHLQIGENAVIQINSLRKGCDWFELVQGKSIHDTIGRLGVMASVIESGVIRVGDPVVVLEVVLEK